MSPGQLHLTVMVPVFVWGLVAASAARPPTPRQEGLVVAITRVGGLTLENGLTVEKDNVDGTRARVPYDGTIYVTGAEPIAGVVAGPIEGTLNVYLIEHRNLEARVRAETASVTLGGLQREATWQMPRLDLYCPGPGEEPVRAPLATVQAIVTRALLRVGERLLNVPDAHVLGRSQKFHLACGLFERTEVRITHVNDRAIGPADQVAVGNLAKVRIETRNAPPEATLQLVVHPVDNPGCWVMEHVRMAREGPWEAVASIGRADNAPETARSREEKAWEESDLFQKFWIYAVVTNPPLPPNHSSAGEWLSRSAQVRATSKKVNVVRSILSSDVRLAITRMGDSNDGHRWRAERHGRVEGSFDVSPLYRPRRADYINLLVRRRTEGDWYVAGWARLSTNRRAWIIVSGDLEPPGVGLPDPDLAPDAARTYRAMAIVTSSKLKQGARLTADFIHERAISFSEEVEYYVR